MGNKQGKTNSNIRKVYDIKEKLGAGSFAIVKRGVHKKTGKEVAVKIIKKKKLSPDELASLHDEAEILRNVDHENIVKMFDVYESADHLYMVLEILSGGELFDRIVAKQSFSEKEAVKVLTDIIMPIKYMHTKNTVHRDLKPENLIYASEANDAAVKITDFGLAKRVAVTESMLTPCGTPGYVAPEVLKSEPYGPEVDLWSTGVILYIMLCGFPPFYDETAAGLYAQIKGGKYSFPSPYWDNITPEAKDLVTQLLTVDPKKRATSDQVLAHPWVSGDVASDVNLGDGFTNKMRAFNARRKLRKVIHMVMAINKLARTIGGFELDDMISPRSSVDSTAPEI